MSIFTSLFPIPPAIPLFAAGIINVTQYRKRYAVSTVIAIDVTVALLVQYLLPKPSIVPWWGPLTTIFSQWYRIFPSTTLQQQEDTRRKSGLLQSYSHGPLGPGASKVVQVLVAIVLWTLCHDGEWPHITVGPMPSLKAGTILIGISLIVNIVLFLWSRNTQSRGQHSGVHRMVQSTSGRNLTFNERCHFATVALINATCEEITSRWFWWQEFQHYYPLSSSSTQSLSSSLSSSLLSIPNLAQATIFGIWHYHGIPSGIPGIVLTFLYGWLMGVLMVEVGNGGLCLPIVAHAIADYYLFSTIARGKAL
jgi:hypothetical protein